MPKFGKRSLERLATCHPDLQIIAHELIKRMDVTVLCGYRGEEEQNEAFRRGASQLQYPESKHNQVPSRAIDLAPYPISWSDIPRFEKMLVFIKDIALEKDIKLRFGADFSFKDYPHIELVD